MCLVLTYVCNDNIEACIIKITSYNGNYCRVIVASYKLQLYIIIIDYWKITHAIPTIMMTSEYTHNIV